MTRIAAGWLVVIACSASACDADGPEDGLRGEALPDGSGGEPVNQPIDQPIDRERAEGLVSPSPDLASYPAVVYHLDSTLENEGQGTCMDIPGGAAVLGAPVNQYPCHGGPAQQFYFEPRGDNSVVRNASTGMCVMPDAPTGSGFTLAQAPCDPANQAQEFFVWAFDKDHQPPYRNRMLLIWAPDLSYCVAATPGADPLELVPCSSDHDQIWEASYPNLTVPCAGHCGGYALVGCGCWDGCAKDMTYCCADWEQSCAVDSPPPPPPVGEDCSPDEQCCDPAPGGGCWQCWPAELQCP